ETSASAAGIWSTFNAQNQALAATLTRIFAERQGDLLPALIELSDGVRKALTLLVMAAVLGLALLATRGPRSQPASKLMRLYGSPRFCRRAQESVAIGVLREFSVFLLLALLLSPMTSPSHMCMALPALL